jgi:uncharacterized protein YegP (UPF0339 family)
MKAYIQPFIDQAGKWRWRLRSEGNHAILASSEAYSSERKCMDTVQGLMRQYKLPVRAQRGGA